MNNFKLFYHSNKPIILFCLLLLISIFNLFYKLNDTPVETWDEAIYGVNAYEMLINKNPFIVTFGGILDHSNLKPALGVFLSAIGFKLFGANLFGLRFFSALAGLVCILFVFFYAKKLFGLIPAFFSGIVLATSYGFICKHGARNGDFDVTLSLFLLLTIIFLHWSYRSPKYFYLSAITLMLGFLEKSFAIFPVLPSLFCFALKNKVYKFKDYIFYVLVFLLPLILWFFARYSQGDIESLEQMFFYDFWSRLSTPVENHKENVFYYFNYILKSFFPWSIFLIVSILIIVLLLRIHKLKNIKSILKLRFILIWLVSTLFIFSLAGTKLYWYIMPIYPALSLLIGCIIEKLICYKKTIIISLLIICSIVGEFRIITNITKNKVEKNSKEQALLSLKKRQSLTTICLTEPLSKSEFFIAEVLKNLTPASDNTICTNPLKQNNLCLISQNNKWQVVECKNKEK